MGKAIKKILIAILAIVIALIIGITVFTGRQVFMGSTNLVSRDETLVNRDDFKESLDKVKENYKVSYFNLHNSTSKDPIPAIYIKNDNNQNIAVLIHGLGGTKETNMPLVDIFMDLGYNVIAYDQRNSGDNTNPYNTIGVLESYDALSAIDFAKNELPPNGKLVLWGQSYGGITAAIAAARDDSNIDYLILDCPVSNGNDMMDDTLNQIETEQGIPADFMRTAGDFYTKAALGYDYKDMDARRWIAKTNIPTLITNASEDTLTPPYMAEDLYNAIGHDKKEVYTAVGYKHGQFPFDNPKEYEKVLKDFIRKY